ncbi:MAG TPA: LysE family transporter, partial [Chitinophagaceae bacterium]|nr:LysE family transporter [Chitinophagaceae bacterium]
MLEAMLKGLTFGLLLSLSVGPVLFTIIKQSLNNGHKGGVAFILGVSASDISLVLACNIFTGLFEELKTYKTEVGVVGCAFLVTMGIYFLFFKKIKVNEEGKQVILFRKRDYAKIFLSGYLINTLNPSVFIFWIGASTQVINHTVNQRIIVFVVCLTWMLGADTLKVFMAGKIRN